MDNDALKKLADENLSVVIDCKSLRRLLDESDAFNDWIKRTDWVQAEKLGQPGAHRLDVMKAEIERLRVDLSLAENSLRATGWSKNEGPLRFWHKPMDEKKIISKYPQCLMIYGQKVDMPSPSAGLRVLVGDNRPMQHVIEDYGIQCAMTAASHYESHVVGKPLPNFAPRESDPQPWLMKFNPATGEPVPYPSNAAQYRKWHGSVAWLFNPWTGDKRSPLDIGSDVHGLLIVSGDSTDAKEGA